MKITGLGSVLALRFGVDTAADLVPDSRLPAALSEGAAQVLTRATLSPIVPPPWRPETGRFQRVSESG
ncbi:MAG TPA: hypothetical protein VK896_09160 [Gaiellaceae bacterium]|nr:hypothetical protein [Gaiellaceae bacterium]